jgi:NCS1 family nucleobase:cation symporter-1
VPYAVLARASFGWRGARIPAVARAIVACGWYGIQTWIGGGALLTLLGVMLGRAWSGP